MRKVYLLLFLFGTCQAHAQVSNAWKTEIESVFQHVNRTPVTTGLLNDYGLYFTNIDKFTGIPNDTNYIELEEWHLLYSSLYSCRFNSNITMNDPDDVFTLIDSLRVAEPPGQPNAMLPPGNNYPAGTVLFAGLHYKYERFKSNASPSLVYVSNNEIYDKPGRPTTPYEIQEAFAVSPTRTSFQGSTHTFVFRPDLFYTNTGKTISTFKVDFDDGTGYQTLAANIPTSVIYETEGIKTMRIKITYTDNSFKESRTKIKVVDVEDQQSPNARYSGASERIDVKNFPLSNFPAPKPYPESGGKVGKAKVTIEYTNPEKKIRKPLIMIEGFDPWRITSADNPIKNYSFDDFIGDKGIDREIDYTHDGTLYTTLSDALEGEDYDLIFVDFEEGTDYIQRNAYLVENIIEWVNSVKEPYNGVMQKNVVMGASMGGLVARYALRDMELSSPVINHDTRLYVSFDTPHQGANFPLGFQAMVSHLNGVGINAGLVLGGYTNQLTLGGLSSDLGNSYRLLNSPAARQMLIYSAVGTGNSITVNNSIHESFMTDYTSKGYPQLGGIRNLVIANGSECGTNQGFEPHAEFLNYHGGFRIDMWAYLAMFVTSGGAADLSVLGPLALTSRTDIKAQFVINALPNQSAQRVYRGRVYIKKTILWGLITKTVDLFDKSFNAPAAYLPIDNNGGGIYDLEELAGSLPFPLKLKRFNFVPTFSSLDIGGGQQSITLADVTRPYSPAFPPEAPKNVKANNFFANPSEGGISNEIHTQVTLRNGRWLFQEIVGEPAFFSCSASCIGTDIESFITGPSVICTGQQSFILNNMPGGTTVTWQATPSGLFASGHQTGTGNNALTEAASSIASGSGTLTFTINEDCGPVQVQKTIWAGAPNKPTIVGNSCSGSYDAPCFIQLSPSNNYFTLSLTSALGSYIPAEADWQWEKIAGNFYFLANGQYNSNTYTGSTGNIYISGANPTDNPMQFRCRVRNTCGWGEWRTFIWNDGTTTPPPPPPPAKYFVVYPNPTQTACGITLADANIIPPNTPLTAELYNISGILQATSSFSNYAASFYTGNLTSGGTYYIIIRFSNSSTESHTLYKL